MSEFGAGSGLGMSCGHGRPLCLSGPRMSAVRQVPFLCGHHTRSHAFNVAIATSALIPLVLWGVVTTASQIRDG